ncbi:MAG: lasso peptide biosynthesis B2 protein [Verrucomicrobiota bacterium]
MPRTIRPIIGSRCLARGIVLYYLLRRRDLAVSLCFGMGKLRGEFVGHCWLCEQGEPLAEVEDPRPLFTVYHIISPSFEPGLAAAAAGA